MRPNGSRATQMSHPISPASVNLEGWNLVCANLSLNHGHTQNFSPIGQVVPEIWLIFNFYLAKSENWPYLCNHSSDWAEILCVTSIRWEVGTHQISALQVDGCPRYWVTHLSCTIPIWPSFQCNFENKNRVQQNINWMAWHMYKNKPSDGVL